ncbi:MAG: hypothetical protein WA858_15005 [Xanthobacteraceae bacterium]|jgi:hypothetical protein
MRRIVVLSLVLASILSSVLVAGDAKAGTLTPPLLMSGSDAPLIVRVTNVCGANGCVRVQTQRVTHQKPGSVAAKHI